MFQITLINVIYIVYLVKILSFIIIIFQVLHHKFGSSCFFYCDFIMVYTTIPHSRLRGRLKELVQICVIKKNDLHRYKYHVVGWDKYYFVKNYSDSTKMLSETDIIQIFELLPDYRFAMFGGHVFPQRVSIPMGTNCAPLFAYLFLHSYEADVILHNKSGKKLSQSFNFTFYDIDDVLPLNNIYN